jgi:hypothetical protein
MSFSRKYDARLPPLTVRNQDFLRTKHLTGRLEYEFRLANVSEPTGCATLTVDTPIRSFMMMQIIAWLTPSLIGAWTRSPESY